MSSRRLSLFSVFFPPAYRRETRPSSPVFVAIAKLFLRLLYTPLSPSPSIVFHTPRRRETSAIRLFASVFVDPLIDLLEFFLLYIPPSQNSSAVFCLSHHRKTCPPSSVYVAVAKHLRVCLLYMPSLKPFRVFASVSVDPLIDLLESLSLVSHLS